MKFPKSLNAESQKLFERITRGIDKVCDHTKLDAGNGYMPLCIECIDSIDSGTFAGTKMISLAHYYTQNGDAMADPEVCFYVFPTGKVFGYYYRCDGLGIDATYMTIHDDKIQFFAAKQADLTAFCEDTFLKNIIEQQEVPE